MDTKLIVWDSTFEIGVTMMDEQHRGLVTIINSAFYCASGWRKKELFIRVLSTFQEYARIHFMLEEELLEHIKYPDLAKHAAAHSKTIQELTLHIIKIRTTNDPDEVMKFFRILWFGHIETYDRLYVKYVNEYMNKNA